MNESGRAVGEAMRFYKLDAGGRDRVPRRARSRAVQGQGEDAAAAPPGITACARSTSISAPDFRRVRIGIGHPGHKDRVTGYVLGNYAKAEIEPLTDLLGAIAAEAPWLAEGDDVRFMNDVALRTGSA